MQSYQTIWLILFVLFILWYYFLCKYTYKKKPDNLGLGFVVMGMSLGIFIGSGFTFFIVKLKKLNFFYAFFLMYFVCFLFSILCGLINVVIYGILSKK